MALPYDFGGRHFPMRVPEVWTVATIPGCKAFEFEEGTYFWNVAQKVKVRPTVVGEDILVP